ncbi:UDP-glycosyltransferase 91C1-like [Papaver somniferum]|uniref:UDP-glycosyltransferase 91C1-like n=1 Tax=Papaver somniferum TaxID=3469 RepID=UPI000E702A5A|nr:UDP-glycosyltransferase 91C1-like [Papaver somniferum]
MEIKENQHHIMLFPWLAFGHVIPFLELSKSLASKGCEATVDLKDEEKTQYLKKAYDELQAPVELLLIRFKPDLIIYDLINCWIPDVGTKINIPTAFFSVYSTPMLAYAGPPSEDKESNSNHRRTPQDFVQVPGWISFASTVSYRLHEAIIMSKHINNPDITGLSTSQRHAKAVRGCNFILARSCIEFGGDYLNLLGDFYQKPVIPIGLLPPPAQSLATKASDNSAKSSDSEI